MPVIRSQGRCNSVFYIEFWANRHWSIGSGREIRNSVFQKFDKKIKIVLLFSILIPFTDVKAISHVFEWVESARKGRFLMEKNFYLNFVFMQILVKKGT